MAAAAAPPQSAMMTDQTPSRWPYEGKGRAKAREGQKGEWVWMWMEGQMAMLLVKSENGCPVAKGRQVPEQRKSVSIKKRKQA